jgi:asparagine synthase (glutamine-hydrolysing)
MCGITGFFKSNTANDYLDESESLIVKMSNLISHRGPDQQGIFTDNSRALYLAHQRLSILDLTDSGKQPMTSCCGRYVIIFNGEIYNFLELKSEIEKTHDHSWQGHSDTEVLLAIIAYQGVQKALVKLNGMFVFSLFDKKENTLVLARDRFGEKPLYIYSDDACFSFASELRSIEAFTSKLTLNSSAISAQLRFSYIPAPHSIYNEVFKLMPSHYLSIKLSDYSKFTSEDSIPYWSISQLVNDTAELRESDISIAESLELNEKSLRKSVRQRMVSDVPLGAFLSGGIDSTCIVALMQEESNQTVKTFSIGFQDKNYNEAQHAKSVASILGTDHHELYLDPKDMLDYVPKLHEVYDEPFSDSSQLPTLMVSKFAKKHVTVALTGDSGDEVYAGYNRHLLGGKINRNLAHIPSFLRAAAGKVAQSISPSKYDKIADFVGHFNKKVKSQSRVGDNIHKFSRILGFSDEEDLYNSLITTSKHDLVSDSCTNIATPTAKAFGHSTLSTAEKMMWQDTIGYMQNDILTKVDRASMAVSLETRVPFLDNDVFKTAWSTPLHHKLHANQTKYPLRKIISQYVPDEIMNRPKAGFGVPISSWLRRELREWAESLLSEDVLSKSGMLDVLRIRSIWKIHLSGKENLQYELWNVLMFQQWYLSKC